MRYILSLSHTHHVLDVVFKINCIIKRLTMIFVLEKSKYELTKCNFGLQYAFNNNSMYLT